MNVPTPFEQNIHTALMFSNLPKEMLAPAGPGPAGPDEDANMSPLHNSDSALLQFAAPLSREELLRQCMAPDGGAPQQQRRPALIPREDSIKRIFNPVGGGSATEPCKKRSRSAGAMALFPALAKVRAELGEEIACQDEHVEQPQMASVPVKPFALNSSHGSKAPSSKISKRSRSCTVSMLHDANKVANDLPSVMGSSLSSLDTSIVAEEEGEEAPSSPEPPAHEPEVSPAQRIADLLKHGSDSSQDGKQDSPIHESYFTPPTPDQIAAYTTDVVNAVRNRNLGTLRLFLEEGGKERLDCRNRFGESLLHMACRRGYEDVARFLLAEVGVSIKARDDYGRTPLHDACWTASPNHALMDVLLRCGGKDAVKLLTVADVRGHAPFDYARREHWAGWNEFIDERRDVFSCGVDDKRVER